jgi:hypothetical protein
MGYQKNIEKVFSHPNMNLKVRNNMEGLERKKKEI